MGEFCHRRRCGNYRLWNYWDTCSKILGACMHAQWLQLCSTVCDPMDYSLPGSSVHGILQERIMEWVAMPKEYLVKMLLKYCVDL